MQYLVICDDSKADEVVDLCRANNFGLEIQAFHHPAAIEDPNAIQYHKERIAGISLVSMHGPFGDLCPGSFDYMVRNVARRRIDEAYAIASELGIKHIVLHHGFVPHTSARSGWLRRSTDFWNAYFEDKSAEVNVYLENMLDWEPSLLSDVVKAVDRPNLKINLDIGHAHCDSRTTVVKWVETLADQIGYVHMHDNDGNEDQHLGLGQANLPVLDVCRALEQYAPNAIWAIEAEGEGIEISLNWLSDNGFLDRKPSL